MLAMNRGIRSHGGLLQSAIRHLPAANAITKRVSYNFQTMIYPNFGNKEFQIRPVFSAQNNGTLPRSIKRWCERERDRERENAI
jgi:hypothetical protein